MSLKLMIKTKKRRITWNINKFIENVIIPLTFLSFMIMYSIAVLEKIRILEIY